MIVNLLDLEWVENENGNYVCLSGGGIDATVFRNKFGRWQIVINEFPYGRLVQKESFNTLERAMERTEAILRGARYEGVLKTPRRF